MTMPLMSDSWCWLTLPKLPPKFSLPDLARAQKNHSSWFWDGIGTLYFRREFSTSNLTYRNRIIFWIAAQNSIAIIHFLKEKTKGVKSVVNAQIKLRDEFRCLLTVPGIGDILVRLRLIGDGRYQTVSQGRRQLFPLSMCKKNNQHESGWNKYLGKEFVFPYFYC